MTLSRTALLVPLGLGLFHLPLLSLFPLSGDEAYYWMCARHPDWSYFDQPPLAIALVGATFHVSWSEVGVRLSAVLVGIALSLVCSIAASRLAGARAGGLAALSLVAVPFYALGTAYVSTDLLLSFFAVLVPLLAGIALREDRPRLWLAVGAVGGLGGLAKFPAVLYVPAVAAAVLLFPAGRRALRTVWPWLGAVAGAILVSPAFVFGARHDWDNFRFQLVERHSQRGGFSSFVEAVAPQVILVSPILAGLLVTAVFGTFRRKGERQDPLAFLLATVSATWLLFFTLTSAVTHSAPHWLAPGWVVAIPLLAARVTVGAARTSRFRIALGTGLVLGAILHVAVIAIGLDPALPGRLGVRDKQVDMVQAWKGMAGALRSVEPPGFDPSVDPVICDSYTLASVLAFYSHGRYDPIVLTSAGGRHGFAFLYWQNPQRFAGRRGIYVGTVRMRTRRDLELVSGRFEPIARIRALAPDDPTRTAEVFEVFRTGALSADPSRLAPLLPAGRRIMVAEKEEKKRRNAANR